MKKIFIILIIASFFIIGFFSDKLIPFVKNSYWQHTQSGNIVFQKFEIKLPKYWWIFTKNYNKIVIANSPSSLIGPFEQVFVNFSTKDFSYLFIKNKKIKKIKKFKCLEFTQKDKFNIICEFKKEKLFLSSVDIKINSKTIFYNLLKNIIITY